MSDAVTLAKGSELLLEITDLNNLGYGVGRAPDGRAVFVAGTVAGDSVRAQIIKAAKSYLVARLLQILQPSPHREEGFCDAPGACGGWGRPPERCRLLPCIYGQVRPEFP